MKRFAALVLGLGSLAGCSALLSGGDPAPAGTRPVVVAAREIPPGTPIAADDIAVRQMSSRDVDVQTSYSAVADVLGRTARERMLANEPVRDERLARPDAGIGLNAIVTPGRRAVGLSVPRSGLIQPGNYVDVLIRGTAACPYAGLTIQNVRVLAVDSSMGAATPRPGLLGRSRGPTPSVTEDDRHDLTLELMPGDAAIVGAAESFGSVAVQVRSDIDYTELDLPFVPPPACLPLPLPTSAVQGGSPPSEAVPGDDG